MTQSNKPTLLWFHQDLRLSDHKALHQAGQTQQAILPLYIHSPQDQKSRQAKQVIKKFKATNTPLI